MSHGACCLLLDGSEIDGVPNSLSSTPGGSRFNIGTQVFDFNVSLRNVVNGSDMVLGSQWDEPDERAWLFILRGDGLLNFRASADGIATTVNAVSTTPVPLLSNVTLRVQFQPDNGAGGWTTSFFTREVGSGIWNVLGSPVTDTPDMSVFASSAPIRIGAAA